MGWNSTRSDPTRYYYEARKRIETVVEDALDNGLLKPGMNYRDVLEAIGDCGGTFFSHWSNERFTAACYHVLIGMTMDHDGVTSHGRYTSVVDECKKELEYRVY